MIAIQIKPHSHSPEKFENGGFTLKTLQTFSADITQEKFEKQKSSVIFDLCFKKTRAGKWQDYRYIWLRFRKDQFLKYFPSKLRRNEGVLKFVRFEERFEKAVPYSWLINCGQGLI